MIKQKKICLLGDFAVGKTSLIRRFVEGRFDEKYLSTIGVTVARKTLERAEGQLRMLLWDLAGGEKFYRYQENYLRGASGALIVMDLTRPESLKSLADYASQLLTISPVAKIVFVGNKADLHDQVCVPSEQIQDFVASFESPILITSAKTGEEVETAFETLADLIECAE